MVKTTMKLPEGIWKQIRIRAIEEGRDAQDVVADALTSYLSATKKGGAR
jgi:plasmid stability protein